MFKFSKFSLLRNLLQHTASHCVTLHHTATHCYTPHHFTTTTLQYRTHSQNSAHYTIDYRNRVSKYNLRNSKERAMLILQSQETEKLILKSQRATRLTMEIEYRIDI